MTISSFAGGVGTGNLNLGSSTAGYQSFNSAGVADQEVVTYCIEEGTLWELGTGTYTASGTVLARTDGNVIAGSAGAGTKETFTTAATVFLTASAADFVSTSSANTFTANQTFPNEGLRIKDVGTNVLTLKTTDDYTADRALTFVLGDSSRSLTFSGNATISGTNAGDQNVYSTIAVPTQTSLAASSTADTLNITTSGAGLSITTTVGTDTITFALDEELQEIAGLTPTDDGVIIGNGTAFVVESGSTLRTSLGLAIGSNVQAYDAQLADIAGLTPSDGNFIVGNGTNFVAESGATARLSMLPAVSGQSLKVLRVNAGETDVEWVTAGGGGTVTSVALSGGTTGLSFSNSPITTSGTMTASGTLVVANGGTGLTTYATGDLLYSSATDTLAKLAGNTTINRKFLSQVGNGTVSAAPTWEQTIGVANGGTGASTFTVGKLLKGNGTSAVQEAADGQDFVKPGTVTVGAGILAAASASGYPSLNIPPGTAPSAPASGDIWNASGLLLYRDNASTTRTLVTLDNTQTLSNKTLTTPVISTISNTGTLTLPTSTDTLVGRDTTDTLTNKTLTSPTINNGTSSARPAVSSESGTLTSASANKTLVATASITINNSVFTAGDVIVVYNNSSGNITITAGTITTMRLAGTATTGSRTLAQRGIATLYFNTASEVIVGGTGVT